MKKRGRKDTSANPKRIISVSNIKIKRNFRTKALNNQIKRLYNDKMHNSPRRFNSSVGLYVTM